MDGTVEGLRPQEHQVTTLTSAQFNPSQEDKFIIEKLPGHNIQIPQQHFAPIPPRPVIPTAAYAKTIGDALSKIFENMSPLARAREAAQMAQLKYMTKLYQGGNLKPMTPLDKIHYAEAVSRIGLNNARRLQMGGNPAVGHAFNTILSTAQASKAASDAEHGHGDSAIRAGQQASQEMPLDKLPQWMEGRTVDQLQPPVVPVGPVEPRTQDELDAETLHEIPSDFGEPTLTDVQ